MNMKAVIPLSLAVILGLVAAILVRNAIARNKSGPSLASNLVTVVVAKGDVEPGKELAKEDLTVSKIPAEAHEIRCVCDQLGSVPGNPLSRCVSPCQPDLHPRQFQGVHRFRNE